jgi:hypothetical protein
MTNFRVGYSGGKARIYRSGSLNKILYSSGGGSSPTPTSTLTPTPTPSPASSSYISLSYTGGSWSGLGTSSSPFISSSTFTTGGAAAALPFSFTASSDCEITVTLNHTTYIDDNGGAQDLNYAINGTIGINLCHRFTPSGPYGNATGTQTRMVSLLSGQTLTVKTNAGKVDTYSNISVYATSTRPSNVEFMSVTNSGNNQWTPLPITIFGGAITGIGTADNKFTFPTPLAYNYLQYGWGTLIIRTLKACTVNYSCAIANVADDNGVDLNSYKIRQSLGNEAGSFSYTPYDIVTEAPYIHEGTSGSRSFTATANTFYRLYMLAYPGNNVTDLKVWTT